MNPLLLFVEAWQFYILGNFHNFQNFRITLNKTEMSGWNIENNYCDKYIFVALFHSQWIIYANTSENFMEIERERENREMWRQNIQTIKIATESNLNIFLSELTRDTTANKNPAQNLSRAEEPQERSHSGKAVWWKQQYVSNMLQRI